ncbi:5,10-methylenetetrahydrofolate reductase (NAD(P)) [Pilibacter termitis]|uniref:Methylenetetrahydrofolate reductase n=1 Tax=Pilibacter termitis TaxID=263852 RepID=A0A1T4QBW9_9ENTE|nr:methylenetetrahydrofolate reductase [Pilibacter termitis]SKA01195.1 5,10-methylenetetrahydrofolate reductase (NAD(P)) [Pilibacter termitis]
MKIEEIYQQRKNEKKPVISLEIFPPKKDSGIETLYQMMDDLKEVKPDFISVTYGAGGSSLVENKTLELASFIKENYNIETLHHLTCVNKTKEEIDQIVKEIQKKGIENILALRGDISGELTVSDFPFAKNLIREIHQLGDFSVGAACYPEGHIDELCSQENTAHLLAKEQAGVNFFISQLFFENERFYRLLENARAARIYTPISAGIMPIMSRKQVERMIFLCGASLPTELIKIIHKYENDLDSLRKAGLEYALNQADDLIQQGVEGIHFYSMNQSYVATSVLQRYGGEH